MQLTRESRQGVSGDFVGESRLGLMSQDGYRKELLNTHQNKIDHIDNQLIVLIHYSFSHSIYCAMNKVHKI
jgi:hypothetical protein